MQIYKITNLKNGKIYIGKDTTNNINYYGSGLLIKRAINKFGVENFKKEILEECDTNEILCEKEKYWISYYNTTDLDIGYNISKGGDGGNTISNNPNKDKIVKKISESMKERFFSEGHRKNLSRNHHSSKFRKGKKYEDIYGLEKTKEYKEKLKLSRKKYKNQKERLGEKYESYVENLSKRFIGNNNPMKKNKYHWYHNPETKKQIRVVVGNKIPDGFLKGRGEKIKSSRSW
jgi:hypothetical protein